MKYIENIMDNFCYLYNGIFAMGQYLKEEPIFSSELMASFLGAIIGGIFTLWGSLVSTKSAHKNNLDLNEKKSKEYECAIILAISEELRVLLEMFKTEFEQVFNELKNNKYLTTTYYITEEYFIAYKANADKLGLISDNILRSLFIEVHINANRFIEYLRLYNTIYHQVQEKRTNFLSNYDRKRYNRLVIELMDTSPEIALLKENIKKMQKETDINNNLKRFLESDEAAENLLSELSQKLEELFDNILNLNEKIQQRIKIIGLKEKENDRK